MSTLLSDLNMQGPEPSNIVAVYRKAVFHEGGTKTGNKEGDETRRNKKNKAPNPVSMGGERREKLQWRGNRQSKLRGLKNIWTDRKTLLQ